MGHDKDDEKKSRKNGSLFTGRPGAEEPNAGECGGSTAEFTERLRTRIAERGGDPFSMAYELTRIYANSGSADGKRLASTFAQLFELFEFGRPPVRDKGRE